MRVAQLLCAGRYAGAEAVACALASALRPQVERSFLYLLLELRADRAGRDELVQRVRALDIPTRVIDTSNRVSWSLLQAVRSALREDDIEVVHSHSYKAAFMAPIIRQIDPAAVRTIAFTLHGLDLPRSWGLAYLGAINTVGALGADILVACSRPIERFYRRWPFLAQKTHYLPNALSPAFIASARDVERLREGRRRDLAAAHALDPSAVWIAVVGRLVPVKQHALLLRAVARLCSVVRGEVGIQLLIAGEGPLRGDLERQAQALGLTREVAFLGQVSAMDQLYGSVDIAALVSSAEGSPMAVLEAMAFGVPVIATRVGGIQDQVLEGETALLVASADEEALVEGLQLLVRDAETRRALGAAGRRRVESEFGPDTWASRHVALYARGWGSQVESQMGPETESDPT